MIDADGNMHSSYHQTDALILQRPRRRYRTSLAPGHFQLRSQVSAEKQDTVYYLSGSEPRHVSKLTTSGPHAVSETIKHLPFPPRCLVAKNGWVCCGGESGEFAAFSVSGSNEDDDTDARQDTGANGHPPANSSSDDTMPALVPALSIDKSITAQSKSFGKERINCITLWFPPPATGDEQDRGAYSQPVAVLASNDKRVIVVGLESKETLDELHYPDFVNRAVLSPNGRLLSAICDDPYLYVHERTPRLSVSGSSSARLFRGKDRADFEWRQCAKIHLKSQKHGDESNNRGSFAACFSHSGEYLAVGTQYGVMSVFLTAAFLEIDVDPLITTFTTSRPNNVAGAVRDMAFCPGPFDLLAWTEHSGRVGIADVRSHYLSRQTLEFSNRDEYEDVAITDSPSSIDPRLLGRADRTAITAIERERRSISRGLHADPERYQHPLTADETMVLEALMGHRRRRDANAANATSTTTSRLGGDRTGETPAGSSASPTAIDTANRRVRVALAIQEGSRAARERSAVTSTTASVAADVMSNIMNQRDRIREQTERMRARRAIQEYDGMRHRGGLSPSGASNIREWDGMRSTAPPPHPPRPRVQPLRAGDTEGTSSNTLSQLARMYPASAGVAAWNDMEQLYMASGDSGSPAHEPGQGESTGNRQRDRTAIFGSILNGTSLRDWDDPPLRRNNGTGTRFFPSSSDVDPGDTAGLSWSENGRIL